VRIDWRIAKGYSVDRGNRDIESARLHRAYVSLGARQPIIGDRFGSLVSGSEIERARRKWSRGSLVTRHFDLGDYDDLEENGVRYHHIIVRAPAFREQGAQRTVIGPYATARGLSRPRSYWPRKPWRSTIASTTSMRSRQARRTVSIQGIEPARRLRRK